jgi:hypothetical protein
MNQTAPADATKREPKGQAKTAAAAADPNKAAEAKVKKEKKEPSAARPRLPKYPDDHVITVMKPNAKRAASGERFNVYKTGMTVKQYVDIMTAPPWNRTAGQVWADIRWDLEEHRKFIHIGPTVVDVPKPPEPAPAKPAAASGASPTA